MKSKYIKIIIVSFLILITTFLISGTYAKYISQIDLLDEARVAKWDIEINKLSRQDIDLFSDSYLNGAIEAANGDNVVAPGASGEYKFEIVGQPEVRYRIVIDVDPENTFDDIGQIDYFLDGDGPYTLDELAGELQNLYSYDRTFEPGNKLEKHLHTISWKWDFEKGSNETEIESNDKIDTALGNQAVIDKDDYKYETQKRVKLSLTITAEQVTLPNGELVEADKN